MKLGKLVGYTGQTSVRTELVAGLTTFLTMSYILAVNPDILSQAGMSKEAVFTATALSAAVGTFLMAVLAKLPIALAPAMGVNAFFAFTLVQGMGLPWQAALAAVFIEGIIFILITLFNVREAIVKTIPLSLRYAISAGIGMFISFIGLKNAGIIVPNQTTYVMLGEFNPISILAIVSIMLSGILMKLKVKGALFYSILLCTLIGIPLGVTQIPDNFVPVSMPHSLEPTFMQFDFAHLLSIDMAIVVFVLIFMDLFDTLGTLIGVTAKGGLMDKDGNIPNMKQALMADAVATTAGAMFGTSTVGAFVESAAGISEGGRTGLTAITVAILFIASLFFAPFFLLIPSAATTGALFIVGVLMIGNVHKIDLEDIADALPAFVTMLMMVLTYSIADGIILGMLSYVVIRVFTGRYKEISATMYILAILFVLKLALG
ncbi:NCS2 family permease [Bacteroides propionicifaciens]|uniref:NCS2 family permease n=1 Tax=Bacteroides propionicifaciens TaxID=392838 RepID=UPI0003739665|nr:NCS2 family permease [Bacteroides propionicifaciens]